MRIIPKKFYLDDVFDDITKLPQVKDLHTMRCDVYESNGNYNIEIDIPGYDKNEISLDFDDGILTITAEKSNYDFDEGNDKNYLRRERTYGKITRSFYFDDIDDEGIKASFINGTINIVIPKTRRQDKKRIIELN